MDVIQTLKARLVEETRTRRKAQAAAEVAQFDCQSLRRQNKELKKRQYAKQLVWQVRCGYAECLLIGISTLKPEQAPATLGSCWTP